MKTYEKLNRNNASEEKKTIGLNSEAEEMEGEKEVGEETNLEKIERMSAGPQELGAKRQLIKLRRGMKGA